MAIEEQLRVHAVPITGKQLQRAALFRTEAVFLKGEGIAILAYHGHRYATGNVSHPVAVSRHDGCCNVAPRCPHSKHRA
jgi:hypothetical protein